MSSHHHMLSSARAACSATGAAGALRSASHGVPRRLPLPPASCPSITKPFTSRAISSSLPIRSHSSSTSSPIESRTISNKIQSYSTMSAQPAHPTLLIPGPIEFDDEVLKSMSHYRYVTILSLEFDLSSELLANTILQQRVPRWPRLRQHLRRDPDSLAPARPIDRPQRSAIHHQRIRYSWLGHCCCQPCRGW